MKKILIICLSLLLTGIGCKDENPTIGQAPLLKTKWTLSYIRDIKTNARITYPNDAARKISIIFTDSLNTLFFTGVCNGGRAKYSFSYITSSITISDLFTTQIGCYYDQWEIYTDDNLMDAYRYKIIGDTLIIYSKGSYNLFFSR
jgi:META domain.